MLSGQVIATSNVKAQTIDLGKTGGFYFCTKSTSNETTNKATDLCYKYPDGKIVKFGRMGTFTFSPSVNGTSKGEIWNGSPSHSAFGTRMQPSIITVNNNNTYTINGSGYYSPNKPKGTSTGTLISMISPVKSTVVTYFTVPNSADYTKIITKTSQNPKGESDSDKLVNMTKSMKGLPIYASAPSDPSKPPELGKPGEPPPDQQTLDEQGYGDDDCPLSTDGNFFTKWFVGKPICGALNVLINIAAGFANWTINSLFVPSLGLQYGS